MPDTLRRREHAEALDRLEADPVGEIARALHAIDQRVQSPLPGLDADGRQALDAWRGMLERRDLHLLRRAMTEASEWAVQLRRYSPWGRWWS